MAKKAYRYLAFRQKEILLGPRSNVYIYALYMWCIYNENVYTFSSYIRQSIYWLAVVCSPAIICLAVHIYTTHVFWMIPYQSGLYYLEYKQTILFYAYGPLCSSNFKPQCIFRLILAILWICMYCIWIALQW